MPYNSRYWFRNDIGKEWYNWTLSFCLHGVTAHHAEVKGPVDVKLQLSVVEETFPMYVANKDDACILGMKYLMSHQCKLDFQLMKLTIGRRKVLLNSADQKPLLVK